MNSSPTQTEHTTLAAWPLVICQALEAIGINPDPLLESAQLNRADFVDKPDGRVDVNLMTLFWQAAEDATQDPAFALSVANYVQPMHFRSLGLLMLTTGNLESALLKLGHYSELVSNSVTTRIETTPDLIGLCIDPIASVTIHPMSIDSFFATLLAFTSQLGALNNPIDHVELLRPKPLEARKWQQRFNAPIKFSAKQNCLWFKRSKLKGPGVMGDEKMAAFNESMVKEYISNMHSSLVQLKVKGIIITMLEDGEPNIQPIADQMHMSERSLRRRLKEEDVNYRDLLQETRMELAEHYLLRTQLPITNISLRLVFTDTSNFSRAFARWFKLSPSQYRAQTKE
jgi:AraC-like DNA-binding protein